jgi:hypothetical protein
MHENPAQVHVSQLLRPLIGSSMIKVWLEEENPEETRKIEEDKKKQKEKRRMIVNQTGKQDDPLKGSGPQEVQ